LVAVKKGFSQFNAYKVISSYFNKVASN